MRKLSNLLLTAPLILGSACTGHMASPAGSGASDDILSVDGAGAGGAGPGQPGGGNSSALTCTARKVGEAPLRRLTRAQYALTVQDLLGTSVSTADFPGDDNTNGFEVGLGVSPLLVEAYGKVAEDLATQAPLDKLLTCKPADAGEEACASSFIDSFARRGFRRALSAEERAGLNTVFIAGRDAAGFEAGIRLVIEAVLASPSFLYHVDDAEGPDADGLRKISSFALANRLSYLLWSSMPDDELLSAAEAGKLASEQDLDAQVRRMIDARPEAMKLGFRDFYRQWLSLDTLDGLQRDPTLYPDFSADMAVSLRQSLEQQIDSVVWDGNGDLRELLLSETAFVNESLAGLFGTDTTGAALTPVAVNPDQRRGLLTHPALLAALSKPNQSDPVIRGKFVRERMFCQPLPPPPADIAIVPPDLEPGLTTRERFSEHSKNVACVGCHNLMDPIGFGLEHYDALGRYRELDEGIAIDATGEILASEDANGKFDGALELAEKLAASDQVRDCVATQFFRFAVGRTETAEDACSLESTQKGFASSSGDLRELIVAVVKTDAFRFRKAP